MYRWPFLSLILSVVLVGGFTESNYPWNGHGNGGVVTSMGGGAVTTAGAMGKVVTAMEVVPTGVMVGVATAPSSPRGGC